MLWLFGIFEHVLCENLVITIEKDQKFTSFNRSTTAETHHIASTLWFSYDNFCDFFGIFEHLRSQDVVISVEKGYKCGWLSPSATRETLDIATTARLSAFPNQYEK